MMYKLVTCKAFKDTLWNNIVKSLDILMNQIYSEYFYSESLLVNKLYKNKKKKCKKKKCSNWKGGKCKCS